MLINLNSIDESNPCNFKNRLSDNIVIEPNSFICLNGATITRNNHLQKIVFAINALITIKFMPYDIVQFTIAAGEYTIPAFIALVNANFPNYNLGVDTYGAVCAIRSMNLKELGAAVDKEIEFEFKALGDVDNVKGVNSVLGIDDRFSFFKVQSIFGKTNPLIRPVPGANIGLNACTLLGGNSAAYACAGFVATETTPYNPHGYTPPTNQENNLAMNMAATPYDYSANYFFIAQPNLQNIKFLAGRAQYDDANNRYSSAAFFGSGQWNAPNDAVNNCPYYVSFKNTGAYDFYILNKLTGNFDNIAADIAYEPGDLINIFHDYDNAVHPLGNGEILFPYLSHLQGNGVGLIYFMQLSVGGVPVSWNSTNSKVLDLSEYIVNQIETIRLGNWNNYNTFWEAQGHNSAARPIGTRIGSGVQAENNYIDCNGNGGFLWRQNSDQPVALIDLQTGNANAKLNGTPYFKRYSAGAAPSVSPDVRSHLQMSQSTSGILLKDFPFMISYYFRIEDDTAKLPGGSIDQHTFINSITGQTIVSVLPANGAAHDFEIRMDGGAVFNFTPLDSGANRINVAYGSDYYMAVKYTGTVHQQFIIEVVDMATGIIYTQTQVVGAAFIENVASISNQETNPAFATNYSKSLNGYFGYLRIHTKCQNAAFLTTGWDTIFNDLSAYLISGTISGNVWYGYREVLHSNTNPQYRVVGNINSSRTLTPVFDKDTLSIPKDTTWGDFIAPYFRHSYYVRNTSRITNLDVHDYTGDEAGLINVAGLNPDVNDVFTFEDLDARGNVVKEPEQIYNNQLLFPTDPIIADVARVDIDDKTIYIEIPNLPHRSYNGVTKTQDKTIGVVPINGVNADRLTKDNLDIITAYPPTKTWIPLNNPGQIPLNELHVKLVDVRGQQLDSTEIAQETAVSIEIKTRDEIV